MKILSLSDIVIPFIYSPVLVKRFSDVDMVIDCGDLPFYYLEYVTSSLDVPVFFVRGNHAMEVEYTTAGPRESPEGALDLHRKAVNLDGLLMAGVEGSLRYRPGPFQYSQREMWGHVYRLIPALLLNRIRYGRYLDIFVTHAPPAGIHDQPDLPHRGIQAFRWLIETFKPRYYFHGHIHVYRPDTETVTQVGPTTVINTFGYRETEIQIPDGSRSKDK